MLDGFAMDAAGTRYETAEELLVYCHRVAGVVGLMMCHALGVADPAARRHADDLGIAMQLTNVARDVAEDWARGRLYVPAEWLPRAPRPGEPLSDGSFGAGPAPAGGPGRRLLPLRRGGTPLPAAARPLRGARASRVYAEIGTRVAAAATG